MNLTWGWFVRWFGTIMVAVGLNFLLDHTPIDQWIGTLILLGLYWIMEGIIADS